jgi:hypothetical protein
MMKIPKNLGMTLLAVWLIAFGLLTNSFIKISFSHSDVLAILAIVAGILLFMGR